MGGTLIPVALGAAVLLLAGWVGYPLVLALAARRGGIEPEPGHGHPPITVAVATREPPPVAASRVANLLASEYPADCLSVVVAVDRWAPAPIEAYQSAIGDLRRVRVVPGDSAGGKAANLNAALREVRTALVAFADSAQTWEADALGRLVTALGPARVGAVTGAIATDAERGVFGLFWRYESWLRALAGRRGRVVAVTGAIYALRRACWQPLPEGLICDDLLVPLRVARMGHAVTVEPRARARDPRRFSRAEQLQRKTRTLTGMLQVCAWEPWVLLPWRNPAWGSFLCHKLLRIVTPFLALMVVLPAGWAIPPGWLATGAATVVVAALVLPPLMGWSWSRVVTEAAWAGRLLLAPVHALANALRGRWDVWHAPSR